MTSIVAVTIGFTRQVVIFVFYFIKGGTGNWWALERMGTNEEKTEKGAWKYLLWGFSPFYPGNPLLPGS